MTSSLCKAQRGVSYSTETQRGTETHGFIESLELVVSIEPFDGMPISAFGPMFISPSWRKHRL